MFQGERITKGKGVIQESESCGCWTLAERYISGVWDGVPSQSIEEEPLVWFGWPSHGKISMQNVHSSAFWDENYII